MFSHLKSLTLLVLALILLPGCEGVRKQFGMGKSSPDEFRVVSRAPLTMPPDFGLRPPDPGAARANEGTATNQARQAVFKIEQGGAEALFIMFVDFFGGSCCHTCLGIGMEHDNVRLITGVNLPMLLAFLYKRDEVSFESLPGELLGRGHDSIQLISTSGD